MPTAPTPPGWNPQVVEPANRQQTQDAVVDYIVRTLRALPPGYVFDATRFGGGHASLIGCDDNDTSADAPTRLSVSGDLKLPPGTDSDTAASEFGHAWRSFGWWVYDDDRYRTPNQFGVTPDGYEFQVSATAVPGQAPVLLAASPCFPRDRAGDNTPFPMIITAGG